MNLFVAVAFLAFGELANLLLVSLSVCSILGEIVRKWGEYKNYKGIPKHKMFEGEKVDCWLMELAL